MKSGHFIIWTEKMKKFYRIVHEEIYLSLTGISDGLRSSFYPVHFEWSKFQIVNSTNFKDNTAVFP